MDDDQDMEVGTILSLVETDGTIVVKGKAGSKPLDEGSVLSSAVHGVEVSLSHPILRMDHLGREWTRRDEQISCGVRFTDLLRPPYSS